MFSKKTNSDPTKPNNDRNTRLTKAALALVATAAIAGCATSGENAPAVPETPTATSSPTPPYSAESVDTKMVELMNQRTELAALSMAQEMVGIAESPTNETPGDWVDGADSDTKLRLSEHSTQNPDGTVSHVALQVAVAAEADGSVPSVTEFTNENVLSVELSMYSTDAQGNNLSTVVPYVFNLAQSGIYEGSWVATVTDARESSAAPEQFSQVFTNEAGANDPGLAFQSVEQLDSKITEAEALMRSAG